jgi:hypothetical protein
MISFIISFKPLTISCAGLLVSAAETSADKQHAIRNNYRKPLGEYLRVEVTELVNDYYIKL